MIVSINQPAYLPWLGYFDRIARSDLHIVLDHVQFEKNSFTNRNKIKTPQGPIWLSVPLRTKGKFGELAIKDLEINTEDNWQKKHWAGIEMNYGKCDFFDNYKNGLSEFYKNSPVSFSSLLKDMTGFFLDCLNIKTPVLYSSQMNVSGQKDDLVLSICREAGASTYISGPLGRDYLVPEKFSAAGINLTFHDYKHPQYTQKYGDFLPYMGIVDLLANEGDNSYNILKNNEELASA